MKLIALSVLLPFYLSGMNFYEFEETLPLFFGCSTTHCNNSFLQETKATLRQMGNVYSPEPTDANAPLTKECISNEFWQKISLLPDQQSKNQALKKNLELNFTDEGYPLWRYHIAAAITIAGINPLDEKDAQECLHNATLFQDYELCKLLLEHGANPNGRHDGDAHLFLAKKRSLAELLITHGAQTTVKSAGGWNLLMDSMHSRKNTELITLYRSHGISPLDTSENNTTALHVLTFFPNDHSTNGIIDTLSALLKDLSHNEINKLIMVKQTYNGTVFDTLNQELYEKVHCENVELLKKYFESCLDVGELDRSYPMSKNQNLQTYCNVS